MNLTPEISKYMSHLGKKSRNAERLKYGKGWNAEMSRRGALGLKARYAKLKEAGLAKDNLSTVDTP